MKRSIPVLLSGFSILILAVAGLANLPGVPSGTWQSAGSMASPRSGASATLLQDRRVLISGGSDANGPLASAEILNLDGTFSAAAPMSIPRLNHISVVLRDGRVLVAGGSTVGGAATNSASLYDPLSDSWTDVVGGMSEARASATASLLQDGRVLIAGGNNLSNARQTVEIFDPATGQFSFAGMLSTPRMSLASAVLADGRVLIIGGSNGNVPLASTDIYDPVANTISAGPTLSMARMGHSATLLLDGKILVAGGNNGSADLTSAELFDPATGNYALAGSTLAAPRRDHSAILLPSNNSVLIVGGTSSGAESNTAELYRPWNGTFSATGPLSVPRQNGATSPLSQDGLLLLAGGSNSSGTLASAELLGFATVKTDQADYAPGSVVTITGSGWQPGETVALTLVESPLLDTHPPMTAVADANGNIFNNQFSPDFHDISVRFYLIAVGSQSQAQNTFTDAIKIGVSRNSPTAATISEATGSSFTVTFAISNNNTNPNTGTALSGSWTLTKSGNISTLDATTGTFTGLTGSSPLLLTFHFTAPATPETDDAITLSASITSPICTPGGSTVCSDSAAYSVKILAPPSISKFFAPSSITVGGTSTLSFSISNSNASTPLTSVAFTDPLPAGVQVASTPTATNTCGGTFSAAAGATSVSLSGGTIAAGGSCSLSVSVTATTSGTKNNTTGAVTSNTAGVALTGNTASDTLTVTSTVPTTLVLNSVNPNSVPFGSSGPVTFTATLTRNDTSAGVAGATVNFTVDGSPAGSATTGAGGVATFATYNPSALSVATHNVAASFAAATIVGTNFGSSASGTLLLTVNRATPTITWANPDDITYGTALSATQLNATASVPGTFVYTPASGTVLNAGNGQNLKVDFTPTDTTKYNTATKTVQINVQKAHLTVKADDKNKTYDGAVFSPFTATLSGFVNGENLATSGVTGSAGFTGAATTAVNAGSYVITPAAGTLSASNYDFNTFNDGQLTINKANAHITVNNFTGTYDGAAHGATGSATGVEAVSADLTGLLNLGATFTNVPGGTAHWTFNAGSVNGNYNEASGDATVTINKANAHITVNNFTGTYDGAAHGVTGTATGVEATPANLTSLLNLGATFTNVPGGTAHWTFNAGSANGNYNEASGDATVTINKADAHISVTGYSVTYNGDPHTATGSATGVESPTPADLTNLLDLSGTTHTDAGTYSDTWTFAGNNNYNSATGSVPDSIAKADPMVVATGGTFTYDGNPHAGTGTATGVKGETLAPVNVAYSTSPAPGNLLTSAPMNAGNYLVAARFAGNNNYNPKQSAAVPLTINQADAIINVSGYTGVYDGNPHGATGTAKGVESSPADLNSLLTLGATFTDVPGGTAHWTFAGNTNYKSASGDVPITITQADASITVNGYTGIYDGNPHGATGSATGVKGESLTGLLNLGSSFTDVPGGTAHWTFAGNTNYKSASGDVPITITQADASITVNGYTGIYDGNPHGATGSATGVKGESLTGLLSLGSSFTDVPGGTAHWTFAGNTNYKSASGDAPISITKAASKTVVTFEPGPYTYRAQAFTASATVTGVGGVNQVLTVSYNGDCVNVTVANGCTATATFTGDANHDGSSDSKSITIGKASSTTTVNGGTFTYDGNAHPATVSVTGVGGLNLTPMPTYTGGCAAAPVNVAETQPTACTASYIYAGDANHLGSSSSATVLINKATSVTTISAGFSVLYDGSSHGVTANVTGAGGLNQSVPVSYNPGGLTAPVNPGTYAATATFSGDANHLNSSAGPVTINITFGVCSPAVGPGNVILPPINSDGSSVYQRKGGSTIPVKFRVCGVSGGSISNPNAVFGPNGGSQLTMLNAVRGTISGVNEDGTYDIPDAAFRWDASGQQWIFNMATSNLTSGQTYTFRVNLAYGPASITFVVGVK